jgi:signal transduction histidine kinase
MTEPVQQGIRRYVQRMAPVLQFVLAKDGGILEANRFAAEVTGRQLTGSLFQELVVDFQQSFDLGRFMAADREEVLLNITTHTGLPQSFYFHFEPLGENCLVLGRLDVEELESMRSEILFLNQDLNNLTRQLQKKNSQLRRLNKEKNQFFGMAAHDLRHPLGVIRMYNEFLVDEIRDELTGEHRDFLDYIGEAGRLMESILDDFLDLAVFETGHLELDRQKVSIGPWLSRIVRTSEVLAARRQITVMAEIPEKTPVILFDRAKMEQVMNNLISNAIKYSPEGEQVEITLLAAAEEVTIRVVDHGAGIAEEDLGRLFIPFQRIGKRKRGADKSSGLGLAIVKKIVDAHGGGIQVGSRPGQGSTFSITLPLRENPDET